MTTPNDRFLEATKQGACNFFSAAGSSLTSFGVYSLVTGAGAAPLTAGLAAQMVTAYACDWDPNGEPPPDKPGSYSGCKKVQGGTLMAQYLDDDDTWTTTRRRISEIIDYYVEPLFEPGIGIIRYQGKLIAIDAETGEFDKTVTTPRDKGGALRVIIDPDSPPGATCVEPAPSGGPDIPRTVYEDPESGCVLNVDFQGLVEGQGGLATPVFKISAGGELRSDGGVIGGCNFEPTIYMLPPGGGDGDPPIDGPWLPEWDDGPPEGFPWGDTLRKLAAGLAGNILADEIQKLFEQPWEGVEYRLDPSCSGAEPAEQPVVVEIPPLKGQDAILTRIDALVPLLQAQKDLKQPTCNVRPVREGEWRTISFRSEETSPFGSGRLRKRFRYLSVSGFGLEQLVDYWAGFSFQAGPVIVSHIGATWGEPKVWAASADEGKRVIRHAGGEAGLDPDQVGQWQVSSSRNPRFGVSGTMNVDTTGGYFWITARDGSSERPIVCKT